jgi:hypothetical protein
MVADRELCQYEKKVNHVFKKLEFLEVELLRSLTMMSFIRSFLFDFS